MCNAVGVTDGIVSTFQLQMWCCADLISHILKFIYPAPIVTD